MCKPIPEPPGVPSGDKDKAYWDAKKAEAEYELLEQKLSGKEPHTRWQKVQFLVAVFSTVFATVTALVSGWFTYHAFQVEQSRSEFQVALQHFHNGWPPGVLELGALGGPGLQALVYGVDPTGERIGAMWPHMTTAALDELAAKSKDLERSQIDQLKVAQQENETAIRRSLLLYAEIVRELKDGTMSEATATAEVQKLDDRLAHLTCIQLKLQRITLSVSENWKKNLLGQVRDQIRVTPNC